MKVITYSKVIAYSMDMVVDHNTEFKELVSTILDYDEKLTDKNGSD